MAPSDLHGTPDKPMDPSSQYWRAVCLDVWMFGDTPARFMDLTILRVLGALDSQYPIFGRHGGTKDHATFPLLSM